MKNTLLRFLSQIKDYERESGESILNNTREDKDIVNIFLKGENKNDSCIKVQGM